MNIILFVLFKNVPEAKRWQLGEIIQVQENADLPNVVGDGGLIYIWPPTCALYRVAEIEAERAVLRLVAG